MAEPVYKISSDLLAQIMETESTSAAEVKSPAGNQEIKASPSLFDDILGKAVNALEGVSKTEASANQAMNAYINGQIDVSEVMVETAKMNIAVQLAVTAVTSAVNTFKELTQMQI
ncbi:MAG: flagellar hook-basal body complex protein FliE [Candidatus Margulisiibacteriota bacterium]